jgi:hypothetical protein
VKLDLLPVSTRSSLLDSLEVKVDEYTDELDIGKEGGGFKLSSAMSLSARAYLVDDLLSPISLILLEEPGDGDRKICSLLTWPSAPSSS